jgi:ABC-2 type transport system permease protein
MNNLYKNLKIIILHAREELGLIIKDPAVILIFIIANLVYPVLYSLAYDKEQIKDVEVALVDLDKTATSRQMIRMLNATEGVNIYKESGSLEEAKELFYKSKVNGIVLISENFEKDVLSANQSVISIYADASYFLIYKQVYASAVQASQTFSAGIQVKKSMAKGMHQKAAIQAINPVNLKTVDLYNPASSYGSFVMPSIIIVILQQTLLIGIGILGGTRKEILRYSHMESTDTNKKGIIPFILGKSIAYFITFMFIGIFTLIWIHDWFNYPDKAGYIDILSIYVPFIIANIFLGMAISVFFKHRENAMLFMVFTSIPVVFLSGATWPVEAIPLFLQKLAYISPATFMVPAYQRVRTMGVDLIHVRREIYAMLIQSVVYFVLAYFSFKYIMQLLLKREIRKDAKTKA